MVGFHPTFSRQGRHQASLVCSFALLKTLNFKEITIAYKQMKTILMTVLLLAVTMGGWCQMSQDVRIDGTGNGKFVTQMTFSGDNVTMTYENGSQTKDMASVGIDFDYAVTLSQGDSQGNTEKLQIYGGRVVDVTVNRTVKNSYWAPVCFPFSMTESQIKSAYGEGVRVTKLTKATANSIAFTKVNSITAGEPYLMKLADGTADKTSFSLSNVALNNLVQGATVEGDAYSFTGTIPAVTLTGNNYFYFTTANTLKPLISGNSILALRGYMEALDGSNGAKELPFTIDDTTTGIIRLSQDGMEIVEGDIYDLQGRKWSNGQLSKGIYIINGKKIVVK